MFVTPEKFYEVEGLLSTRSCFMIFVMGDYFSSDLLEKEEEGSYIFLTCHLILFLISILLWVISSLAHCREVGRKNHFSIWASKNRI